ncbi:MAG TPA: ABC transporter permease, partial [Blastocatellia bacterium]|nr:ABC transporter permease [Blastocatellia bacterium]
MTFQLDLRYTLRSLSRNPRFAMISILTLMLGIGACTAVFSVVYAVMLKPLPYRDADRLCVLWKSVPKEGMEKDWTSYPAFKDWKDHNHVFEDLALVFRPEAAQVTVKDGDHPEKVQAAVVSPNFFQVMGISSIAGRTFSPLDGERREDLAVLSYGYWQSRFAGSPDVLGKSLHLDRRVVRIIGVMPESCQFPSRETQFWLLSTSDHRWPQFLTIRLADAFCAVGRLKPQVSLTEAQADLKAVAGQMARSYPEFYTGLGVTVVPLETEITGKNLQRALWLLLSAVTLVLLIACANVASLFLTRGFARQSEYAIRVALGAGRRILLQQLLTEAMTICLIAGVLGTATAAIIIDVLRVWAPPNVPRLEEAGIDPSVWIFALGLSVAAALTFGMAPAWKILRNDPHEFLKQGGRTDPGPGRRRLRESLVSLECALLVILLVVTGLLLRSFMKLQDANLGFRPDHLLSVEIQLPFERYDTDDRNGAFFHQAVERISSLPGVGAAAVGGAFTGTDLPASKILVEGRPPSGAGADNIAMGGWQVSDNYFQLMGIPLLRGRNFSDREPPQAAIISEALARRLWPGEDPIGKRFGWGLPGEEISSSARTVIGVVGNTLQNGRESEILPTAYLSARQLPRWEGRRVVVRTTTNPATLVGPIRDLIRSLDSTIPKIEITTVEAQLSELDAPRRFQLQVLGSFSIVALILAAIGIYSVLSYSVEQRTREIGLKIALGAQPRDVVRSVLAQGM